MAKRSLDVSQIIKKLSSPPWAGVFYWDEFFHRVAATPGSPKRLRAETEGLTELDVSKVRSWLQSNGLTAQQKDVRMAIEELAESNSRHPVREYLESCGPGTPGIVDNIALSAFGIDPESQPLANLFLRKWLIAAVRRIRNPGEKVDTMLLLIGEQGLFKSSFFKTLFGEKWFTDTSPDMSSRDGEHALEGNWCVEFGEFHQVLKTEKEVVKAYLARAVSKYRQYGNGDRIVRPRQTVFAGTTNREDILRDETGDRRFWPLTVRRIDLDWVRDNRNAIWGEVCRLEAAQEPHWLSPEEETLANQTREGYRDVGPWDDALRLAIRGKTSIASASAACELVKHRLPEGKAEQNEFANALRRLGCKYTWTRKDGVTCRHFLVPASLRDWKPAISKTN